MDVIKQYIVTTPTPFFAVGLVSLVLLYYTLPRSLSKITSAIGWTIVLIGIALAYKMSLQYWGTLK